MKGALFIFLHPLLPLLLLCLHFALEYVDRDLQRIPAEFDDLPVLWPPGDSQGSTLVQMLLGDPETLLDDPAEPIRAASTEKAQDRQGQRRLRPPPTMMRLSRVSSGGGRCAEDCPGFMKVSQAIAPIVFAIISIIIWIIASLSYKSRVVDQRDPFPNPVEAEWNISGKGFKYGICGCCTDTQYCLHGCCCLDMRLADTYASTGIVGFWTILLVGCLFAFIGYTGYMGLGFALREVEIMEGINMGGFAALGFYLPQIVFAGWMATNRGKLREKLGGQADQCLMDFICWWWCACCVTIQEARQVDEATSVRVECCCKLLKAGPYATGAEAQAIGMIGQPVAVGEAVGQISGGLTQPATVVSPGKAL